MLIAERSDPLLARVTMAYFKSNVDASSVFLKFTPELIIIAGDVVCDDASIASRVEQ